MTLEQLYDAHCRGGTAIAAHLPRLRALATGLEVAVEFGVKKGASSTALLLGANRVFSVDLASTKQAQELKQMVGDRWDYRIADSRTVAIPECDLLFLDSHHSFAQVDAELKAHASKVRRYIVCHDVLTFGSIAAKGEDGQQAWTYQRGVSVPVEALGIRPAIDAFQVREPAWRIVASYPDSHGLLVLEKDPPVIINLDGKAIAGAVIEHVSRSVEGRA